MEITTVNKTGITKVSDTIKIKYSMSQGSSNEIKSLTATISKDDVAVGFFNTSKNEVLGFSLREDNGLTADEIKLIFQNVVDDSKEALK